MNAADILALPTAPHPRIIKADDDGLRYHIAAGEAGSTAVVVSTTPEALAKELPSATAAERTAMLRGIGVNGYGALGTPPTKLWRLVALANRLGYTAGGWFSHNRWRVITIGDSVACDIGPEMRAFFGFGGADADLQSWTRQGGAVPSDGVGGNYPSWSDGVFTLYDEWARTIKGLIVHLDASFTNGTWIERTNLGYPFHSVHVGYLAGTGYGRFKLQYKANGAGSWIDATSATLLTAGSGSQSSGVVNSDNTAAEVYATAVFNLPLADVYHLRLVATTGRVRLTHVMANMGAFSSGNSTVRATNSAGAASVNFAASGRGIGNWANWSQDVVTSALAAINPQIIVYKSANQWSLANYESLWPALATKLFTAAPNALLVVCGSHPRGAAPESNNAGDIAVDDYLREWCATQNGAIFVDVRQSFPPYLTAYGSSTTSTDDLWSDGIHIYGEPGNLAGGEWWVRRLVFEAIRPGLEAAVAWSPPASISTVLPNRANEIRLFDENVAASVSNPHKNKLVLSTHPRFPSEVMLRPMDSGYNGGTGRFDSESGWGMTSSFESSPRALFFRSNGQDALVFGNHAGGALQGLTVGVSAASTTNFARTQQGWRFRAPWAVYGGRSGLIAEGRDDSPADMRVLGVDRNSTDAAAGAAVWSWYPGGSVAYHGVVADAFETIFTYQEPAADTVLHHPVGGVAGSGVNARYNVVAPGYTTQSSGQSAVGYGEIFWDEATGRARAAVIEPGYTVGTLPSAATAGARARAFVTDSNATHAAGLGAIVAAGGANFVPVYSDGTNWRIG